MNDLLILEAAYENEVFIGYRITIRNYNKTYLVFANQEEMPGIRVGEKFSPQLNREIIYRRCDGLLI